MFVVPSSIVLIGSQDSLAALRERLDSGAELHTFADTEALEALDHVIRHRPRIVAMDHEFSTTSRGTALINRIKDDPTLSQCEVRVIAHDGALNRVGAKRGVTGPAIAVDEPKASLDQRGTRRAPRIRIREGIEVLVDGNAAGLVDMSTVGAQVVCATVLKPNQRVRMTFSDPKGVIRCSGAIAWASFEMPKGMSPRYRAGIELIGADADALKTYAERHENKK